MLDALGIDATAEVVYREMPAHPQEGVAELVRGLKRTEQEVREALDTLGELALVWHSPKTLRVALTL
ncbi:hypothetical protein [Streptomyces sp. NPDC059168]|uniref:hypothetical protein n=1 Tax=Streptomyces sp. NPDC059168 TaxID=3346753 RepID=UPI00367C50A3